LQAIFAIAKELEENEATIILNWLERKENLKKLVITNPTLNWPSKAMRPSATFNAILAEIS
jgi:monomeric isocitrate dehydrogenase